MILIINGSLTTIWSKSHWKLEGSHEVRKLQSHLRKKENEWDTSMQFGTKDRHGANYLLKGDAWHILELGLQPLQDMLEKSNKMLGVGREAWYGRSKYLSTSSHQKNNNNNNNCDFKKSSWCKFEWVLLFQQIISIYFNIAYDMNYVYTVGKSSYSYQVGTYRDRRAIRSQCRTFLVVQWVRLSTSTSRVTSSIPGGGSKLPCQKRKGVAKKEKKVSV